MSGLDWDNINEEVFVDIPGFEGLYQVSNFGNVKSLERRIRHWRGGTLFLKQRILKPKISKCNLYKEVTLYKNKTKRSYTIHKLMHMTFTDKFNQNKPFIDHIDHDRQNNNLNNLRECTHQENMRNQSKRKNSSSKYVGVYYVKPDNRWRAMITIDGKKTHIGYFKSEYDASIAFDTLAKKHYGEFANLNHKDIK